MTRARLYVTALGVYEVEINGRRVGDHVLAPGLDAATATGCATRRSTSPPLMQPGANAVGAMLADGWYRGRLGSTAAGATIYGDRLGLSPSSS